MALWRLESRARSISLLTPLRSPGLRSDLAQVLKAVLAAVVAWFVAAQMLGLSGSFLAPWTALLAVHATVYRSFSRGIKVVVASLLGILIAYLMVEVLGATALALALALLVGMLLGLTSVLRDEASAAATTALFVITAGQAEQGAVLLDRILSTGVGAAAGLLVNVLVWAPLDDRLARSRIDGLRGQLAELLRDISDELSSGERVDPADWIERSRRAEEEVGHAWQHLRHTREARRGNPRPRSRRLDPGAYEDLLLRLDEGFTQARAIARTVERSQVPPEGWDERFREPWLALLHDLGDQLDGDGDGLVALARRMQVLTDEMSHASLPEFAWPVYGALIDSTRNLIDVLDEARPSPHGAGA